VSNLDCHRQRNENFVLVHGQHSFFGEPGKHHSDGSHVLFDCRRRGPALKDFNIVNARAESLIAPRLSFRSAFKKTARKTLLELYIPSRIIAVTLACRSAANGGSVEISLTNEVNSCSTTSS
jgi:hypothetical protein